MSEKRTYTSRYPAAHGERCGPECSEGQPSVVFDGKYRLLEISVIENGAAVEITFEDAE